MSFSHASSSRINPEPAVTFSDFFARPVANYRGYGEYLYRFHPQRHISLVDRLEDLIRLLLDTAHTYHVQNFCERDADGNYKMKPGYENHITRFLTPEFMFYTNPPLFTHEFAELKRRLMYALKTEYAPNFHFLLSSFAVKVEVASNEEGDFKEYRIHNRSLYFHKVDYSSEPKLIERTKAFTYHKDPYAEASETLPLISNATFHQPPIFISDTAKGTRFFNLIDICLEHLNGYAKNILNYYLQYELGQKQTILPTIGCHIVTANSTDLMPDQLAFTHPVHADLIHGTGREAFAQHEEAFILHFYSPITKDPSLRLMYDQLTTQIQNIYVPPCDVAQKPALCAQAKAKEWVIQSPPFGPAIRLTLLKPRLIGQISDNTMRQRITEQNVGLAFTQFLSIFQSATQIQPSAGEDENNADSRQQDTFIAARPKR